MKQPKQAKPSKRRKRNDWNLVTRPKKKKQSMIIKTLPFVLFRLWSTPDLTHGRIVLSIAMMWWFVLVVKVVSFSKLRWFGFGGYGRFVFQITVVWFRSLRSFRFPNYGGFVSVVSLVSFRWFSFAVSGFSTCCLARLHFTSELNSYLYRT